MPTFQALIDKKIKDLSEHQRLRIQKMQEIEDNITHRPLIVYAGNMKRGGFTPTGSTNSIEDSDIVGISDLIEDIQSDSLDVFLHSPGGSAEATERIVNLLRANFNHIRFIIPHSAYSAATMLALSGDEILMDERSTLGPIDPQIVVTYQEGGRIVRNIVSAQEILDAFDKIREILKKEPDAMGVYLPMLQKYDLHIFEICENAKKLSFELVQNWLETYMFKDKPNKKEKAKEITEKFASHQEHLSHGRTIGIMKAKGWEVNVTDLRDIPELRQAIWELYCMIDLYFDRSPALKFFENTRGVSWSRLLIEQIIQAPIQQPQQPPTQVPPPQSEAQS